MGKAGKQIINALKEVKEFIIHPGKQAIYISGESVIISKEHYNQLKEAALRDKIFGLDDDKLAQLVKLQIKAASEVARKKLPRVIEARSAAGVIFTNGFEDVISEMLVAAKRVDINE